MFSERLTQTRACCLRPRPAISLKDASSFLSAIFPPSPKVVHISITLKPQIKTKQNRIAHKPKGRRTTWKDSWPLCSSVLRLSKRNHPFYLKGFRTSISLPWQQFQFYLTCKFLIVISAHILSISQSAVQLQVCFRHRGMSLSLLIIVNSSDSRRKTSLLKGFHVPDPFSDLTAILWSLIAIL